MIDDPLRERHAVNYGHICLRARAVEPAGNILGICRPVWDARSETVERLDRDLSRDYRGYERDRIPPSRRALHALSCDWHSVVDCAGPGDPCTVRLSPRR
jgi:hypothetical protein